MRASFFTAFCMLGGILASPVQLIAQDTAIIEIAIRSAQASIQNLATLIQGLETHKGADLNRQVNMITRQGKELSQILRRGADDISKGPDVTLFESTNLLKPIQGLADSTQKAVDAWINSRNTIISSGGRDAVREILRSQEIDAQRFTEALNKKLPVVAQYIGNIYANQVKQSIERAIGMFT